MMAMDKILLFGGLVFLSAGAVGLAALIGHMLINAPPFGFFMMALVGGAGGIGLLLWRSGMKGEQ